MGYCAEFFFWSNDVGVCMIPISGSFSPSKNLGAMESQPWNWGVDDCLIARLSRSSVTTNVIAVGQNDASMYGDMSEKLGCRVSLFGITQGR